MRNYNFVLKEMNKQRQKIKIYNEIKRLKEIAKCEFQLSIILTLRYNECDKLTKIRQVLNSANF